MQQRYGWKERLADSSWVTLCWDWFMTLVGRVVEAVLWVTMAFSCYQLIPGAPQAPAGVSACAFIAQFLGLDVGGLGLSKLAEQQGLGRWAYARVVSYVLIGITLVTVAYAGIQHAVQVDASVTKWVEVSLVLARSTMTVLYGRAVQSLRAAKQTSTNQVTSLQEELARVQEELDRAQQQMTSGQAEVSRLRGHLDTKSKEVDSLHGQLAHERVAMQENRQQLATELAAVQESLHTTHAELATMQAVQAEAQKQSQEHGRPEQRVVLHAVPRPEQQSEQDKFDTRAFVFACLQENPTAKLAELAHRALTTCHVELSHSTMSRYRKQYFARCASADEELSRHGASPNASRVAST